MTTSTEIPGDSGESIEPYVDDEFTEFFKKTVEEHTDESIYVVPSKLAREILTDKRLEIIDTIREEEIDSKRQLARKLERDIKSVSRDLDVLWENGIIDYREENNNRKIPELSADKIIIEPL